MRYLSLLTVLAFAYSVSVAGPIAQWHFDESPGATVAVGSVNGANGALQSTVQFVSGGISGNALQITPGGCVDMGNICAFGDQDFSILLWVKLNSGDTTAYYPLCKHYSCCGQGYFVGLNMQGNGIGAYDRAWFYTAGGLGQQASSTTVINDGKWHQIAVVYHHGGVVDIYVDGSPTEQSKQCPINTSYPAPFRIGGTDTLVNFNGMIDEVQVYSNTLTDEQIQYLYQQPSQSLTDDTSLARLNMTFWLKAQSGEGYGDGNPVGKWNDSSGNHFDMTNSNPSQYPKYISDAINDQPALRFDGDDFYQRDNVSLSSITASDEATAFIVCKEAASQAGNEGRNTIFSICNGSERFLLHTPWENTIALQHGYVYTAQGNWAPPANWDDNWHVIEFVRDNPVFQCIIDGTDLGVQYGNTTLNTAVALTLYVGNDGWGNTFQGDVGEIMVYNKALTMAQRYEIRRYLSEKYGIIVQKPISFELFAKMAAHWLNTDCASPLWCDGGDADCSGQVNMSDFISLIDNWLK